MDMERGGEAARIWERKMRENDDDNESSSLLSHLP